jgi:hypothetical protein
MNAKESNQNQTLTSSGTKLERPRFEGRTFIEGAWRQPSYPTGSFDDFRWE